MKWKRLALLFPSFCLMQVGCSWIRSVTTQPCVPTFSILSQPHVDAVILQEGVGTDAPAYSHMVPVCVHVCARGGGGGARGLGQYRNPGCLTPDGGHWGFTVQTTGHTGSSPGLLSRGTAEALFILVVKVLVNFHSHSFDLFNQPFQGATLFVQDIGRQQQDSR